MILLLAAMASLSAAPQQRPAGSTVVTSLDGEYVSSLAPSPDDRWLVFGVAGTAGYLSITPLDGGARRVLVPADDRASLPVWFGDGTRLAYHSDRLPGIVVSDFDASAGALVGAPRRVTLEPVQGFDVSPDGDRIAYVSVPRMAHNVLRLVSTRGGPARTLVDLPHLVSWPRFSPDGRHVYFTRHDLRSRQFELRRVAVDDGSMDVVLTRPHGCDMDLIAEPARQLVLERCDTRIVVLEFDGDTVASVDGGRFDAEANFAMRLGADGRSLLLASTDIGAAIRAYPTTGSGGVRQLSDAGAYHWPAGWSADGRSIFFEDSSRHVWSVALDGSGTRQSMRFDPVNPPADTGRLGINGVSSDGRYWLISQSRRPLRALFVYDTSTRALREITATAGTGSVGGPGGSYQDWHAESGEFMYSDVKGARVEIRAVKPDGTSRVITTFARGERRRRISVHGQRVEWPVIAGDSSVIYIASGSSTPRAVWTSKGQIDEVSWSHDGRSMVVALDRSGKDGPARTVLVFLSARPDGSFRETARTRQIGGAWDLFWTPDDRAVLFLEYSGGSATRVARVPAHSSGPFTYVVPEGAATFWDHFPSPAGTHVVVPAEQYRGSSILRIDLAAHAARSGRSIPPSSEKQ